MYTAISTIKGILATGRFKLLFKPNLISIDSEEKNILINASKKYSIPFDAVAGVDIYQYSHCADIDIETTGGKISVRCLDVDKAQNIKDILNTYVWETSFRKTGGKRLFDNLNEA